MKTGKVHIVLLMFLAALAGCRDGQEKPLPLTDKNEKDTFSIPVRTPENSGNTSSFSRFEDVTGTDHPVPVDGTGKDSQPSGSYRPSTEIAPAIPVRRPVSQVRKQDEYASALHEYPDVAPGDFFRNGRISGGVYLAVNIDNDMWDYTDYYYTGGQSIEFYHPLISVSPLAKLLPSLKGSINFYSITLFQNLYTPTRLTWETIRIGDRPFAAYLCLGHRKSSLSPERRMRLDSQFDLGVIGPGSLGSNAQEFIHSDKPVGWIYQVQNDVVINYSLRLEKGLIQSNGLDVAVFGGAQAGSLYDNLSGGLFLRLGKTTGRYEQIFQTTSGPSKFATRIRYYASLNMENRLVMYDATLQGGLFNRSSAYTLRPDEISRYVFCGRLGIGIGLGRYSLEAEQVFLTPEFESGKHHFWLRIRNIVRLN